MNLSRDIDSDGVHAHGFKTSFLGLDRAAAPAMPTIAAVEGRGNLSHNRVMDKEGVVQTLRAHEPELRAAGIIHLRVFGSVARGEASSYSDVDLMADLDGSKKFSLLDMSGLENRLSDILQVKVDLTLSKSMRNLFAGQPSERLFLPFSDPYHYLTNIYESIVAVEGFTRRFAGS